MKRTYLYKLHRSHKNEYLHELIDISAEIYNHCIAIYKTYFKVFNKYPHKFKVIPHITKLKKRPEFAHWNKVASQAIQNIPERINEAYQLFFKYKNTSKRPPSFCKRENYSSFTLKQCGYKVLGNQIRIQDEVFYFYKSRDIAGKIKTVTVKRDKLHDIYIAFSCDIPDEKIYPNIGGKTAAFVFGFKNFITASDGYVVKAPQFFRQGITSVKRANRRFGRTENHSREHEFRRLDLARVHRKIFNQRKDFQVKLARKIAIEYRYIILEDLNIEKMKRERNLGRKFNDMGFFTFVLYLKMFAEQMGSEIIFVDNDYGNFKICNCCNEINEIYPKDKYWTCTKCNVTHDRDINMAKNILKLGKEIIEEARLKESRLKESRLKDKK